MQEKEKSCKNLLYIATVGASGRWCTVGEGGEADYFVKLIGFSSSSSHNGGLASM
jgi:hypothetical protein